MLASIPVENGIKYFSAAKVYEAICTNRVLEEKHQAYMRLVETKVRIAIETAKYTYKVQV